MGRTVHTREEHVLCILVFVLGAHHEVGILLVGRSLVLALIYRGTLGGCRTTYITVLLKFNLRGICLTIEQGARAILLATEILAKGEDVLGRVLVHGWIGRRTDDDERIARIAYHEHEHAEERGVLDARVDKSHTLALVVDDKPQDGEDDDADDHRAPTESIEGNAEHCHRGKEGDVLALLAAVVICLPYCPDDDAYKECDVDNLTGVERATESVDEEQFKPSAHAYDARNDTI